MPDSVQSIFGSSSPGIVQSLRNIGGLTFFTNYSGLPETPLNQPASILNASFSSGAATATFSVSRGSGLNSGYYFGSPTDNGNQAALYLNLNDNSPRICASLLDSTGIIPIKGLMIEKATTNLLLDNNNFTTLNWAVAGGTVNSQASPVTAPFSSTTLFHAVIGNSTVLQTFTGASATRTFSIYILGSIVTGNIEITTDGGATWTPASVSTVQWRRFSVTQAVLNPQVGVRIVNAGDEVYLAFSQLEALPYATSPLLTTSAAVTRNREILSYSCSSNRTGGTETIFYKFMPFWDGTDAEVNNTLLDSDTKRRILDNQSSTNQIMMRPNETDSSVSRASLVTVLSKNTVYTIVATMQPTSDPNVSIYLSANSQNTSGSDYTPNVYGTNFQVAYNNTSTGLELTGIVKCVGMYNRMLSNSEVSKLVNILNSI